MQEIWEIDALIAVNSMATARGDMVIQYVMVTEFDDFVMFNYV